MNIAWPLLTSNSVLTKTIFLHDSELGRKWGHGEAPDCKRPSPATKVPPPSKTKRRTLKQADTSKVKGNAIK